jgi:thiosulfate/3-mercaptopyruvate sulfurtransferase
MGMKENNMKRYEDIISSQELFSILNGPDLVIIDCNFELANPNQGFIDYQKAHIPSAFYANLDRDLASPATPETGRHPLPTTEHFSSLLASWQVNKYNQVVVYDAAGGSMAVRLWFLLRYFGVNSVAVLDGGFKKWVDEGYPVTDKIPEKSNKAASTLLSPNTSMIVSTAEMENIYRSNEYKIIDARAAERYQGKTEPVDKKAGHIPGALNRFHGLNLNDQGVMKSSEELKKEFSELIASTPADKVIVYCGSGVTSCHHLLALKRAGIEGVRLYAGSWSEWICDPNHPIATH